MDNGRSDRGAGPRRRRKRDPVAAHGPARGTQIRNRTGDTGFTHVGVAEIARFSAMRRRFGYQASNEIVAALAARIDREPGFEAGRLGRTSIEFLFAAPDPHEASAAMRRLKTLLQHPLHTDGILIEPEIFIGFAAMDGYELHDELFDIAALAAEDARRLPDRIASSGRAEDASAHQSSRELLKHLAVSIRAGALDLHYMPKLRLSDGAVASVEALCRWTHESLGAVSPALFIPLAEEAGLIGELTLWTIDRAIADQDYLRRRGVTLDIDVNMSGQLVGNAAFCGTVMAAIKRASGHIGLEITETAVIDDLDAALTNLRAMADAGVSIAIDDFGSGLSSLAYLRDLPARELKIDRAFVQSLTTSNRDPLLVRSAIEIAHALEMEVTAEGVEDEIALALLKVMGCDNVQGFHVSPPMPVAELQRFLANDGQLNALSAGPDMRLMLRAVDAA